MIVIAATATPFNSHGVGVCPFVANKYCARTVRQRDQYIHNVFKGNEIPMALLLLNDKRTDKTANAVGKKYLGRG